MRILIAAAASALALTACSSSNDGDQDDQDNDPVASTVAACKEYLKDYAGDSSQLTADGIRELSTQAQDEVVQNALTEAAELLPGPATAERTRALLRGRVVCDVYLRRNPSTG